MITNGDLEYLLMNLTLKACTITLLKEMIIIDDRVLQVEAAALERELVEKENERNTEYEEEDEDALDSSLEEIIEQPKKKRRVNRRFRTQNHDS